MKLKRTTWVLLVGLLLTAAAPASARKWTSDTGEFSVEAELVEAKGGNVRLKRQDGKIITVPLTKLSKADRDFLASIDKAKKKNDATKATPEEVIAAIKKLGGQVKVDNNKAVVEVRLVGRQDLLTDAGLEHLKGLTNLQTLYLSGTKVTDAGMEHLKGLTELQVLYLSGTQVTDAGLEHLKGLTNLRILALRNTNVTDAGLEHLKGLTNLIYLGLNNTNVTDAGVKKLQQALPICKIIR